MAVKLNSVVPDPSQWLYSERASLKRCVIGVCVPSVSKLSSSPLWHPDELEIQIWMFSKTILISHPIQQLSGCEIDKVNDKSMTDINIH